jgi:sulfite exporter TauE/SafE
MNEAAIITAFVSLLLAGLAGSLHCVGMCGPILLGFSQVFERSRITVHGRPIGRSWAVGADFACYHAGRLWTYAMLGFAAGWVGQGLRASGAWLGWQRPVALAIAVAVILCGVALLGIVPSQRVSSLLNTCGLARLRQWHIVEALLHGRGPVPRLLLGAVMGLLPCGLVYAMLVVVAALPHPLLSAAGMIAFGIGTLPALTAVLLAARVLPEWVRRHGTRLAAVTLIVTGAWMFARTLAASPETGHCPFCVTPTTISAGTLRVPGSGDA